MNQRKLAEQAFKRNLILDAAESLFKTIGIEETTMEAVAKSAGYTRKSIYNHFVSWDDICLQVLLRDMKIRVARRIGIAESEQRAPEKLYTWGEERYQYCCQNPVIVELQTYLDFRGLDENKISPDIMQEYDSLNMQLKDYHVRIIESGVADGSLREDININYTISHFAYSLRSIIKRALDSSYSMTPINSDEYFHQFLESFIRGISK